MVNTDTQAFWKRNAAERSDKQLNDLFAILQMDFEKLSKMRLVRPYDGYVKQQYNNVQDVLSVVWTEIQIREKAGENYIDHYEYNKGIRWEEVA